MRHEHGEREYGPHLHCDVIAALTALGTGLTAGAATGTTAAVIGGISVASTAASLATTGVTIAQATNKPDIPQAPIGLDSGAKKRTAGAQRRFTKARTRNVVSSRSQLGGTTVTGAPTTLGPSEQPSIP